MSQIHGTPSHQQSQPPVTPSHQNLLPAISPSGIEHTPAPLHVIPPQFQAPPPHHQQQPHMSHPHVQHGGQTPVGGPRIGQMGPPQSINPSNNGGNNNLQPGPNGIGVGRLTPGPSGPGPQTAVPGSDYMGGNGQANVFGQVMGNVPGQGPQPGPGAAPAKVYASCYSGIPVFEAMIRGISVMRRTSDSWVNATQILKVAGIPKSARTKILDKEILIGVHEKVQGGYGKYQGTWIPFPRGQELAAQYGVTQFLSPIFDFIPSPSNVAALPMTKQGTPDRKGANHGNLLFNAPMSAGRTPGPPSAATQGRIYSPLPQHMQPPYSNGDNMMMGMTYPMYYPPPQQMTPTRSNDGLQPPVDINGYGLPPSHADLYIDQYGQPQPTTLNYVINGSEDVNPPPAKRQRSDEGQYINGGDEEMPIEQEPVVEEDEAESDPETRDAPPLHSSMRLASKPLRPKPTPAANRARSKLLSLFSAADDVNVREVLGLAADAIPDFDIDMIIDNEGHTALHWACALAKTLVVTQLIELGADIHRGNYAGETPLIRSVLTTNHAEAGSFPQLLEHLSPSIRTLDQAYRSVIHHIALIAGVKGRATSARAYMTGVLEWVAKERPAGMDPKIDSSLMLRTLIDIQDVHGDTALNVAARVGNRSLVTLLLDAGADKVKANKLGLKPVDFGIETEALKISPAEAVVSNLKSEVPKPERQSRDVQKNISAIFETISDTFSNEMLQKQTKLNATEASVRHATRALADKRQQVQRAQAVLSEMEQIQQRSENIRKAMSSVNENEWTGRAVLSSDANGLLPPAFQPANVSPSVTTVSGEDIPLPERGVDGALIELRRIAAWEDRMANVLQDRIQALQGESADKSVKYRKLVSLCTKVEVEKVDGMLDGLVAAIESDGQSIDLSRISTFMTRMKEQKA